MFLIEMGVALDLGHLVADFSKKHSYPNELAELLSREKWKL